MIGLDAGAKTRRVPYFCWEAECVFTANGSWDALGSERMSFDTPQQSPWCGGLEVRIGRAASPRCGLLNQGHTSQKVARASIPKFANDRAQNDANLGIAALVRYFVPGPLGILERVGNVVYGATAYAMPRPAGCYTERRHQASTSMLGCAQAARCNSISHCLDDQFV